MRRPPAAAVAAALLAVYLFWGSTYLGIRFAIDSLPPFAMAAVRFVTAGLVLTAFALAVTRAARPTAPQWLGALAVGGLMLTWGNGAVVWSERFVPTGIVAVVVCTSAVWMVVFDRVLNGVRLRWPQVVGTVLGLAGIVVLANPTTRVVPLLPAIVLATSSAAWGLGTVVARRVPLPSSVSLSNGLEMVTGGLMLLVPALIAGELTHLQPQRFTETSLLAVGYLVIAGSLIGFSCYLWLIRVAPVALISTQSYVSPVVAVVLGVLIRNEPLTLREVVAGAVILGGVALIASAPLLTPAGSRQQLASERAA